MRSVIPFFLLTDTISISINIIQTRDSMYAITLSFIFVASHKINRLFPIKRHFLRFIVLSHPTHANWVQIVLWKLLAADIWVSKASVPSVRCSRRSSSDSGCFHQKGADEAKITIVQPCTTIRVTYMAMVLVTITTTRIITIQTSISRWWG